MEIQQRIPRCFRLDVLVRSPEEIACRVSHNDWFLREMLEKGDVLYDVGGFFKKSLIPTWKATNGMNPLTLEWAENAEEDYATAKLL